MRKKSGEAGFHPTSSEETCDGDCVADVSESSGTEDTSSNEELPLERWEELFDMIQVQHLILVTQGEILQLLTLNILVIGLPDI